MSEAAYQSSAQATSGAPHKDAPNVFEQLQGRMSPTGMLPFGARPVQDWLALSGKGLIDIWANPFQPLPNASFVAEFRLPLPASKILLNLQTNEGIARSFSLFYDAVAGLSLLHRTGNDVARLRLAGPLPQNGNTGRLTYRFDAARRHWSMRFEVLGAAIAPSEAQGVGCLPFTQRDIEQICQKAQSDPAVLWYGFCQNAELPQSVPWIGLRTPIETSLGTVAAGNLRAGDIVLTPDHGPVTLRALHRVDVPARGSFAPILLRAPYYDARGDVLVSANQRIVFSGGEVEYLFGVDRVLVAAGDVVDGRTAVADDKRNVISAVMLDLGCAAISASPEGQDGISLAIGDVHQNLDAPLPCLTPYETVTLLRMMGRIVSRVA